MGPGKTPGFSNGRTLFLSKPHRACDWFQRNPVNIRKDYKKMTPNQQIIPGPRSPESRLSSAGRPSSIEISRPMASKQLPVEASVNYAALLRRHRKMVGLIFCGTILLALFYTLVAHKSYKSEAILEVIGTNTDFMNNKDVDPTASQVTGDAFIETQTKLLKSPPVVQKTAELVGPTVPGAIANGGGLFGKLRGLFGGAPASTSAEGERVVFDMLEGAKVKVDGTSDLIMLTITGPEPKLTAVAANTLMQQFIEHAQDVRMSSAGNTNKFLISELADARKKLQVSEDDLQNYARQTGIVIPSDTQESVAADKLRQIQSDLEKAEADEATTKAQEETAHVSQADSLPQVVDDPTLRDDRSRLADLRRQLSDLSVTLTPANYKIQQLKASIADLEEQSAKHRANIVKRISVQNSETGRRKVLLGKAYQQQLGVVSDQSAKEVRYNILKKEVDANRDLYQSMLQRVKQASIMAALKSSDVRVVSPAQPALKPYQPNLLINLAVGLLCGMVFSTVYILMSERNDASLRSPGQSVKHLNVPELAVIPSARIGNSERIPLTLRNLNAANIVSEPKNGLMTGKSAVVDKEMVQWCQDETMMADAYRSAITSILLTRINGVSPRVILITSPRPKAGKTTTVANLGISLAEIGRRVLLIDGDLRRPRLGKLFGLQFASGLSDALLDEGKGKITLDSVVRPSSVPGLYVLPGGSEPANISKLLHSTFLDNLIETARAEYDFVLIDSPPMVGMADARLLSRNVDGVILISRAGETSPEQLGEARERLADDGTPVIGTILNGCDLRTEDPAYVSHYNSYAGVVRD
jgi:polysaccharide biosynthesis transport protein